MSDTVKIGAINWDCSYGGDSFFSSCAARSLGPAKYRNRTPFYAELTGPDSISIPRRTLEEYEQEMRYAIEAGIDYFAYCWYAQDSGAFPADGSAARSVEPHLWELNYARTLHMQSALRNQLGLAAILVTVHPLPDGDLDALARVSREDFYQKQDGRPLVFLFGSYDPVLMRRIRTAFARAEAGNPFFVWQNGGQPVPETGCSEADAVSDYACCVTDMSTYRLLSGENLRVHEQKRTFGIPVFPFFPMGWNPSPRIDNPVPWCAYPACPYPEEASAEALRNGAEALCDWVEAHPESCVPRNLLVYAWNEFEEGGYICPTRNADGTIRTGRLHDFASIARYFKERLG